MSLSIQQKIAFLYPKRVEEVYQRLCQIINDFRHTSEVKKQPTFSEKDVVLISYPDHVHNFGNHLDNGRDVVGTLKILRQFLRRYVKGLINKVHLLPFYPYSSDEGFSVIDYYKVREDLGDWSDIKALSKDFGLMFDLVLNHVSSKNQWFQRFLSGDQKFVDYFIAFDKKVDTSSVYRPRTHPLLTPFTVKTAAEKPVRLDQEEPARLDKFNNDRTSQVNGEEKTAAVRGDIKYLWTTFSADQIDLNFKNPEVLLQMIKVLLFYIKQGALAVRLDAVRYLWKQLGTGCIDLPQTHMIIKLFRQILEELDLEVWLAGEVKGSLQTAFSYFGNGQDETHLVYNFQLPTMLLYAFYKGEATELTKWLKDLKTPSSKTAFFNVTATHDGIGLTPLVGFMAGEEINKLVEYIKEKKGFINYHSVGDKFEPYELDIVYLDALGGVKPFLASQAIQLALAGIPGIYFNSLIGAENCYEGVEKLGDNRAINREKFDYQKLVGELEDEQSIKHQVYSGYQKLLKARINEPLFSPLADQKIVDLNSKIFALMRFNGGERLLSLTNISNQNVEMETETIIKILEKKQVSDLISGQEMDLGSKNFLAVNSYQSFWLR
jgi:sucrose phosphorylase